MQSVMLSRSSLILFTNRTFRLSLKLGKTSSNQKIKIVNTRYPAMITGSNT